MGEREVWPHCKDMLLYDISAVKPEQSQPRVLTDCGSLCLTPSTDPQPRSLSKNKQTTHCKLDLAATHDVVQERMHLVDLHGRRGSCIRTVWSKYLHIRGLNMGFADLEGRAEKVLWGKDESADYFSWEERKKTDGPVRAATIHPLSHSSWVYMIISLCLWGVTGTVLFHGSPLVWNTWSLMLSFSLAARV